ncbi:unnamed protein product, partial [Brassica oleracea var. botrytis]
SRVLHVRCPLHMMWRLRMLIVESPCSTKFESWDLWGTLVASFFSHCNEASFIFGKEGAWQMAAKKDLKFIGEIREGSDEGVRVVVYSPGSVVSKAYEDLAQNVVNRLKELRDNPENEIQMKLNVPHSS